MSTTDALTRAQNAFEARLAAARRRKDGIERQVYFRKAFAYIAKIIVAVSGLLMTLDAVKPYNVPVGILISAMVTLDYIFSNHAKLLVITQSEQAYRRLLADVEHRHTVQMPTLLPLRATDPEKFAAALIALHQELLTTLHERSIAIEDAINAADVKALTRLSIETA